MDNNEIKLIAFYLPQFHTIPENDKWWGKGFTEWTNVVKAKPLYKGHFQPKLPADLGLYDLRIPEVRKAQADLAKEYGIAAFCYWHYWFGNGKRLLELPFNDVLSSGEPDFPFCLGWANTSWKGFDYGCNNERNLLIEQTYPGDEDYVNHFNTILPALNDKRYYKIDSKPVLLIFQPYDLPDQKHFIQLWNTLAQKNGFDGFFFIAQTDNPLKIEELRANGFDAVNLNRLFHAFTKGVSSWKRRFIRHFKLLKKMKYKDAITFFNGPEDKLEYCFPTVYPNWDHSARSGKKALILHDSKPQYFERHLRTTILNISKKKKNHKIIFIKSWNEWAEGNYLEPDIKFGKQYLETIKKVLTEQNN